jgi:plastocyanin
MYFSTALAAAASLALAQAITIPVSVGYGGLLKFSPSAITANVGDHVEFTFFAKVHLHRLSPIIPLSQKHF